MYIASLYANSSSTTCIISNGVNSSVYKVVGNIYFITPIHAHIHMHIFYIYFTYTDIQKLLTLNIIKIETKDIAIELAKLKYTILHY